MLEKSTFDREMNSYLLEVDGILKGRGLMSMKGTSSLDEIQKEVELTLSKMRENRATGKANVNSLRALANDSTRRVAVFADRVRYNQHSSLSGLGDHGDDLLSHPEWKAAFTQVAATVSDFTNRYSRLISNMDPVARSQVDKALASIIDNATTSYKTSPTDEGAQSYSQLSARQLAALEAELSSKLAKSSAAELTVLVQQKDQERANPLQRQACRKQGLRRTDERHQRRKPPHNEHPEEILSNQSSYDAAIRQKKFRLVDGDTGHDAEGG